jgi:hypothetical protein
MLNPMASVTLFGLVGVVSCAPVRSEVPTVPVNTDFDVPVGGMARIQDSPLLVRFDTVTEDSRCPADVECVWEGNATARVTVDSAGQGVVGELKTSPKQPVTAFGWTFELRQLRPSRSTQSVPKPRDYVLTLRATR